MSLRTLPATIGATLASLRRSLGVAGLILGVVSLPFVLIAVIVSWPLVTVWRWRLSKRMPAHHALTLEDDVVAFFWSGDPGHCRLALEHAASVVVDSLVELTAVERVETLQLRNPHTGFALEPRSLGVIEDAHAVRLAETLAAGKLEYGELVVNGSATIKGLDLEARYPLVGHLCFECPDGAALAGLVARAQRLGFDVPAAPDAPHPE